MTRVGPFGPAAWGAGASACHREPRSHPPTPPNAAARIANVAQPRMAQPPRQRTPRPTLTLRAMVRDDLGAAHGYCLGLSISASFALYLAICSSVPESITLLVRSSVATVAAGGPPSTLASPFAAAVATTYFNGTRSTRVTVLLGSATPSTGRP